ncbi:hypothetical protein B0J18DRAFT_374154 [Chaetomium sp. MPI-SDFR-AT-0129]|nr:hypothetical protein B0J18DRAFT_374154 [Chaetomium sp. MPI-SDFR-AT-0129]
MALASYKLCAHSFTILKTDNNLMFWRCIICGHGPLWFIWQCRYCELYICHLCLNDA